MRSSHLLICCLLFLSGLMSCLILFFICDIIRLYLRVRSCNDAAISLYKSLGYDEVDPASISLTKEDINSNSLEDGELVLLAKDLPIDAECEVECEVE